MTYYGGFMEGKKLGDILREQYEDQTEKAICVFDDFFEYHKSDMIKNSKNGKMSYPVIGKELDDLMRAGWYLPGGLENYVVEHYGLNVISFQGGIGRDYLNKMEFSWDKPASVENCCCTAEK